jgi:hypothetical protein
MPHAVHFKQNVGAGMVPDGGEAMVTDGPLRREFETLAVPSDGLAS